MGTVIEMGKYRYEIRGYSLWICCEKKKIAELNMAPKTEKILSLGKWEKEGNGYSSPLIEMKGKVHLDVEDKFLCYWVETGENYFPKLTYFPESSISAKGWHTYVSDEHDRTWDIEKDQEVDVSSAYDDPNPRADGKGMLDPGDYPDMWLLITPPRVVSFQVENEEWFGLSIPGALPVGITRFCMKYKKFSIEFDYLRPSCKDGFMPKIYFVTGLKDPYDLLDSHREISNKLGLLVPPRPHPEWWGNPIFCLWDEMSRSSGGVFAPSDLSKSLTSEKVKEWVSFLETKTGVTNFTIRFDQGFFEKFGEYIPVDGIGGKQGFRKLIDEWKDKGHRVALYFHPYRADNDIGFLKKHPECIAVRKGGRNGADLKSLPARGGIKSVALDWTHPLVPEYMKDRVRFLLSDEEECLNADWLIVQNFITPDPRLHEFYNPDWGVGDLMTMKVLKIIYESAKEVKKDAGIRVIAGDCYIQPYTDIVHINEDWLPTCEHWYKRARIVCKTLPGTLKTIDAYFVTMSKSAEYWMTGPVFSIPEARPLRAFIHIYGYLRDMREKDYKRQKSSWHVYLNSPITRDMEISVSTENDKLMAYRKYTKGPLASFYSAMSLSRRCFVTYSETQALISSSENRMVNIPLPHQVRLKSVEKIKHDNIALPIEYQLHKNGKNNFIEFHVEDCGNDTLYFRVSYQLGKI